MSLLWCDGFDHYGTGAAGRLAMLDGPYAEISSDFVIPSASNPRSGTTAMRIQTGGTTSRSFRRVFGGDKATVGVGYALHMTALPTAVSKGYLFSFRDNANVEQCMIGLTTTGQIEARTGGITGSVIGTSGVVLTTGAYQPIECRVTIDAAAGAIEVRVNNLTVLDISGVDTRGAGAATTAQVLFGRNGSGVAWFTNIDFDDLFAWDTLGTQNNDFLGDHQVLTLWPNGDTAATDWTRNAGATDYEAIDEADPDDDTTYVAATAAAQVSEYDLDDLPGTVSAIAAVQLDGRMKKTDAGTVRVQQSLVSGAFEFNGADRNITTAYTYWPDISETDPATGAPWTRTALDAALYKIERTA